jgi:SAM-dependent methyltransferase
VAELYGPLRSQVPDPEPYARFITRYGEPALELGCGTGDPILALRGRGLDVDGVDSSPDMVDKCRAAADARAIEVDVFEQTMEALDLPRRYRSIYLAGPTFNLLPDDGAAGAALGRIGLHLAEDGAAMVPLFIPAPTPPDQLGLAREHVTSDGRVQRVTAIAETRDERTRQQTTVLRYESTYLGATETLERPWLLHWHTRAGFTKLTQAAGLTIERVVAPGGGDVKPDDDAFVFTLRR